MAKRKFVLGLGLCFIFGVFLADSGWSFISGFLLCVAALAVFIFRLQNEKKLFERIFDQKFFGAFCLGFFMVGFFYFSFFSNYKEQSLNFPVNKKFDFEIMVLSDSVDRSSYQTFDAKLLDPYAGEIKILTNAFPRYKYGDQIQVTGVIQESDFEEGEWLAFYPRTELLMEGQGFWLKQNLLDLKHFLIGHFKNYLPSDQAALLAGLTFGERGDFSPNFKEAMAKSGVTHIVALSGYNIAILALTIERGFRRFLSRKKRFYLTLGIILFFVVMVGGEASVVRAAIMGGLALLAKYIGRPHDVLHLVVLTAAGMILVDPRIAAADLGFQLSFLSLLGIIFLEPAVRRILGWKESKEESFLGWRENGLTTFSAQLAVLPVLLVNFDYFSLLSFAANILILFAVPFTMFLGFLLAGLASLSSFLGFFVAKIVSVALFYEIGVIRIFSAMSWPLLEIHNPGLAYLIFYGILIGFILFFKKNEAPR